MMLLAKVRELVDAISDLYPDCGAQSDFLKLNKAYNDGLITDVEGEAAWDALRRYDRNPVIEPIRETIVTEVRAIRALYPSLHAEKLGNIADEAQFWIALACQYELLSDKEAKQQIDFISVYGLPDYSLEDEEE